MGLFNLFKKKTIELSQERQELSLSKEDLKNAIITIAKMSCLYRDSSTLKYTGGGRNEKMESVLHSYAGMLGYLYEFTYKFGIYSEIVDKEMAGVHYKLVKLAMDDPNKKTLSIMKLSDNWSDILQSVYYLQTDNTTEGNQMKQLASEIDFVTKVVETISGNKCKKPYNKFEPPIKPETKHYSYDKYSIMVQESSFNPFKITIDPSKQNMVALPEMMNIFQNELKDILSNQDLMDNLGADQLFQAYVFEMVESYFNNAGFVPKSTVDAIIEQCYVAVQQTDFIDKITSLEQMKYQIYYALTHN
ncbi:MAG: hypothetical protein EOM29_05410 [Bacteroidia bacterium]|nr:hypothetical protein [Bacteroidia bacterium]